MKQTDPGDHILWKFCTLLLVLCVVMVVVMNGEQRQLGQSRSKHRRGEHVPRKNHRLEVTQLAAVVVMVTLPFLLYVKSAAAIAYAYLCAKSNA